MAVVDSNQRQSENGHDGDGRMQLIDGVTETPPDGQVLRLDWVSVEKVGAQ